jgi:phage/plasmid-like protein (TIGR03299 family)
MLAKLGGDVRIGRTDDLVSRYLLLTNSHDGSSAVSVLWTPVRVVCQNTLSAALRNFDGRRNGLNIRHLENVQEKLSQARNVLGLSEAYYQTFARDANAMAERRLTTTEALSYFSKLVPLPEEEDKHEIQARNARVKRAELLTLWGGAGQGADIPGVEGTLWTAYNSITELVDHEALEPTRTRSLEMTRETRLASIWFGAGARLKAKAYDEAMAVLRN